MGRKIRTAKALRFCRSAQNRDGAARASGRSLRHPAQAGGHFRHPAQAGGHFDTVGMHGASEAGAARAFSESPGGWANVASGWTPPKHNAAAPGLFRGPPRLSITHCRLCEWARKDSNNSTFRLHIRIFQNRRRARRRILAKCWTWPPVWPHCPNPPGRRCQHYSETLSPPTLADRRGPRSISRTGSVIAGQRCPFTVCGARSPEPRAAPRAGPA
jgi:hypothetical protein